MATITSANSVFMLAIAGLFNTPQQLQGYEADEMFTTEGVDVAEVVMGADGTFSGGLVFNPVLQTIAIMPNSPSSILFERWWEAEKAQVEKLPASATISLKSTGRKYDLIQGYLMNIPQIPQAAKVLRGRTFRVAWGRVTPSPK